MVSRDFEEQLRDMKECLERLKTSKLTALSRLRLANITEAIEIQRARIDFFKRGYSLGRSEAVAQTKLE